MAADLGNAQGSVTPEVAATRMVSPGMAGEPLAMASLPARSAADDVARAVRRHWVMALLIAAAITLLAWIIAASQPKRYRAESIAAVTPLVGQLPAADAFRGVDSLDRRVVVSTIAALASTPRIEQLTGAMGGDRIDAVVLPSTSLVRITVEGGDAERGARIANAIPAALNTQVRSMFAVYGVSMVSSATPAKKASLPRVERAIAAGLMVGLLAGVAVAYLVERRRTAPAG